VLVPLYAFVAGDTLGILVLVHDHETVSELAVRAQSAAAMRVAPRARVDVIARGMVLEPSASVATAGLRALDRVDIVAQSGAVGGG
jgi:toluene-4-monooxygenase system protein B